VIVGIVIGALAAILLVLAALFLCLRARVRRRPSARSLKHLEGGIAHDAHDLSAIPSQQLVVNPFLDPRPGKPVRRSVRRPVRDAVELECGRR
jgi:hypothetical protein